MSLCNVFLFSATRQRVLPCFLALSFVFVFTCYYILKSRDLWNFFLKNSSDFKFLSRILGTFLIFKFTLLLFLFALCVFRFLKRKTCQGEFLSLSLSVFIFYFNIWFQVRKKNKLIAFQKKMKLGTKEA